MGVTSALVLFAVIWAMVFLIALPIRVQTQGDLGEIVPGTHAGAPEAVLTRDHITQVFEVETHIGTHPVSGKPLVIT